MLAKSAPTRAHDRTWFVMLCALLMTAPTGTAAEPSARRAAAQNGTSIAAAYCKAIREPAAEARHKLKVAHLKQLEARIEERLAELDARIGELKSWIEQRERFKQLATERLIEIFSTMRPDAASPQLSRMDETTAAAIVSSLDPRAAAAILAEMPVDRAARLASILSGAAALKQAE